MPYPARRTISFVLAAAGAAALIPLTGAQAAATLKVMTWNIHNGGLAQPVDGWFEMIKRHNPDVVSLQEACLGTGPRLAKKLSDAGHTYHVATRKMNWHIGCGGYQGQVTLSKKKFIRKYSHSYKSHDKEDRGFLAVRIPVAGKSAWIINTHAWNGGSWTGDSPNARELATLSKDWVRPHIVTGDLNALPRRMTPLWTQGFQDADPSQRATYNSKKLDYVISRKRDGLKPISAIVPSHQGHSDHKPLIVKLKFS